ncbi:MAG: integrase zinc binding domain-containing protein, partial [Phycisphaerae bacterium]
MKGKQNVFADWLSRVDEDEVQDPGGSKGSLEPLLNSLVKDEISELLSKVHNSRLGHHGVQRTWSLLNKYFPGHGIPVRVVQDYVSTCPWCQKSRQAANEALKAPIRAVEPNHSRHYCSYDTLYV